MEIKALHRLEQGLGRLLAEHERVITRQEQLGVALAKSREELERIKAQNHKLKSERTETRKRLDILIKRFDSLGLAGDEK